MYYQMPSPAQQTANNNNNNNNSPSMVNRRLHQPPGIAPAIPKRIGAPNNINSAPAQNGPLRIQNPTTSLPNGNVLTVNGNQQTPTRQPLSTTVNGNTTMTGSPAKKGDAPNINPPDMQSVQVNNSINFLPANMFNANPNLNNNNNNNVNNNGYKLLSAQGMETLQVFLREHGNECIKQFVQVTFSLLLYF